jgi:hypothetical protein
MATFSGKGGYVGLDSVTNLNIRTWTVTETATVNSVAHSSSSSWHDSVLGPKSWTATFDFYQDDTTSQPNKGDVRTLLAGDALTNMAYTDGEGNLYFTTDSAVCSEVSYSNDIEGGEVVSGTASFVGSGELEFTNG